MVEKEMPQGLYRSMRNGHLVRKGHALEAKLVSIDNGETFTIVRSCC